MFKSKQTFNQLFSKGRKMCFIFLPFLLLFFLISMNQSRTKYSVQSITLDKLSAIKETSYIIYFARDDCPDCKKTDKYLRKNKADLTQNVYRIETKKEPNKDKLNALLLQQQIKSVPTFLLKEGQTYSKVKINDDKKSLRFQRLSGD